MLCWDNTQLEQWRRHQGTQGTNKILLWANAYAAQDTVATSDLSSNYQDVRDALDIPVEVLLQTRQVW